MRAQARAREAIGDGKHIYAFCHVRTNQVLYSLSRNLRDHALKQLPDIGANCKPPRIRPDLWKPLFNITLPSSEQGLELFRKLKEWRKMHELNWVPPPYLSTSYTEKQMEQMQEQLNNRGGSKKETVYDIIKREKKKMRQKIIMDQKANSIADLAAVLIKQDAEGGEQAERRKEQLKKKVKSEIRLILTLAEDSEHGGMQKLDDETQMIRTMLKEGVDGFKGKLRQKLNGKIQQRKKMLYADAAVREAKAWMELTPEDRQREIEHWKSVAEREKNPKPQGFEELISRESWTEETFVATMQREYNQSWDQIAVACRAEGYVIIEAPTESAEGEFAGMGFEETETAETESGRDQLAGTATPKTGPTNAETKELKQVESTSSKKSWMDMFSRKQAELDREPKPEREPEPERQPESEVSMEQESESEPEPESLGFKRVVPCFPPRFDPDQYLPLPKNAKAREAMIKKRTPIFTTQGVRVQWANFLDAEYAEAWPEAIEHERMSGNKEKLEAIEQKRQNQQYLYDLELAEMVSRKRMEMGLPDEEGLEAVQEEVTEAAAIGEEAAAEVAVSGENVAEPATDKTEELQSQEEAEEPALEKNAKDSAAELAAAEELEAKEAAAREAAILALKEIRRGRKLPLHLEEIKSDILARVRTKAILDNWNGSGAPPGTLPRAENRRLKEILSRPSVNIHSPTLPPSEP